MTIALIVVAAYAALWRGIYVFTKNTWLREWDFTASDRTQFVVMSGIPFANFGWFAASAATRFELSSNGSRVVERRRT